MSTRPTRLPSDTVIPVMRPLLPPAEMLRPYLRRIDSRRVYSNHGPLVYEFETRLAQLFRLPQGGVATASSGTLALTGAVLATAGPANRAKPLAIVPAFTFVATAAALVACGYECFIAEVDERTWMLDPARLLAQLNPKILQRVAVVVPVAPFGKPVAQAPWRAFKRASGIPVVIDGAAAIEGIIKAPDVCLGEIPVALSFHATKSLGVGEGGCIAVRSTSVAKRVVRDLNYGFFGERISLTAGLNGKMSEYHAAVGLAQLDGWFDRQLRSRRGVVAAYHDALGKEGLAGRLVATPDVSSTYVLFRSRDATQSLAVQASLREQKVDMRLWYSPGLHRHPAYASSPRDRSLAITDKLTSEVLGIPIAHDLSAADVARVAAGIANACRH